MSIYIGTPDNVSALVNTPYIGLEDSVMPKMVYIGDENGLSRKIWPVGSLPTGYTQVSYICNTGLEYINTNYIPTSSTKIVFDVMFNSFSTKSAGASIFGSQASSPNRWYHLHVNPSTHNLYSQFATNNENIGITLAANIKYNIIYNDTDKYIYVNGVKSTNSNSGTFTSSIYPLYLFGKNNSGTISISANIMKLYGMQIYDGEILLYDYVPCRRISDSSYGLYDIVNDVFHGNDSGSGRFYSE